MNCQVNCIGVVVVDALCSPIAEFPIPIKKPQVNAEHISFQPGGGAANSSSALCDLGIQTAVYSRVGNDSNGRLIQNELNKRGVNTKSLLISNNESTPFSFVSIHPGGERTFIHTPGTNLTTDLSMFDTSKLLSSPYLFYQDMFAQPLIDKNAGALLADAQKRGIITFLDECYGRGPIRTVFEESAAHADYCLPSADDLNILYPDDSPEELIKRMLNLGTKTAILKQGHQGCLVGTQDEITHIPSAAESIIDGTGAGDCFDAGFIAGIINGLTPVQAARAGALTAADCMAAIGASPGVRSYAEIINTLHLNP